MKLALAIGHGPKIDEGAGNKDGTTELDWNTDLAKMMFERFVGTKVRCFIVHRVIERVQPVKQVNTLSPDLCIELHLNSFNTLANGTEMIYYPGSSRGARLALLLQQAAVSTLGTKDRGIKGPQGGGRGLPLLKGTRCPSVIVESFFIDHDEDLAKGDQNKTALAQVYVNAILQY